VRKNRKATIHIDFNQLLVHIKRTIDAEVSRGSIAENVFSGAQLNVKENMRR